jgi:hypothetical protein
VLENRSGTREPFADFSRNRDLADFWMKKRKNVLENQQIKLISIEIKSWCLIGREGKRKGKFVSGGKSEGMWDFGAKKGDFSLYFTEIRREISLFSFAGGFWRLKSEISRCISQKYGEKSRFLASRVDFGG